MNILKRDELKTLRHAVIVSFSPHVFRFAVWNETTLVHTVGSIEPEMRLPQVRFAWYDDVAELFRVVFEHESFPEIPEGEPIPKIEDVFDSYHCRLTTVCESTIPEIKRILEIND
ncbi:MAG: hypothetical protein JW885_02575 [Deltaproteobacteria bacterium]|nr:hypothetical protein [Candidatus Zymogenaceae bacterium]